MQFVYKYVDDSVRETRTHAHAYVHMYVHDLDTYTYTDMHTFMYICMSTTYFLETRNHVICRVFKGLKKGEKNNFHNPSKI